MLQPLGCIGKTPFLDLLKCDYHSFILTLSILPLAIFVSALFSDIAISSCITRAEVQANYRRGEDDDEDADIFRVDDF